MCCGAKWCPMDEIALLKDLVSIHSPTGSEKEAGEFLAGAMKGLGMNAEIDDAGNAVGTCGPVGADVPELLLIGHIDTVPGKIDVKVSGEKLFGRGSVDAKGPLAAMVCAASCFAGQDRMRIRVVGAVDEEGDSRGARHILKTDKPSYAIVGEPGSWDSVVIGYKGKISLRYSAVREMAHSAGAHSTATDACVSFVRHLQEYAGNFRKDSPFESLSVTVRKINTNDEHFSTKAETTVDFRTPPGFDADALVRFAESQRGDGELDVVENTPPVVVGKNNALVRSFLSAIRENNGKPSFKKKTGTSDMNLLGEAWSVPMVTYGPGDSALDHTPNEHMDLNEYVKSIAVLKGVIARLIGSGPDDRMR